MKPLRMDIALDWNQPTENKRFAVLYKYNFVIANLKFRAHTTISFYVECTYLSYRILVELKLNST